MSAGDALTQYKASLNEAGKATSKFSTVTKTLGSAFKTIGAFALNTAVVAGITVAISAAAKAWDDYSKSQENAIESGNQALSTMEENQKKIASAQKVLDDIKSNTVIDSNGRTITRFEQLSQGVNNLGENVSLSSSEFEEYNSLLDQMSSSGLTATNSISNLENQVKSIRKSANNDTLKSLSDWVESFNALNNQMATDSTKEVGFQQNINALEKLQSISEGTLSASSGKKQSFWERLGSTFFSNEMITQAGQAISSKQRDALIQQAEQVAEDTLSDATYTKAIEQLADKYSLDVFDKKGNVDSKKINTSEMKQRISDAIEQEQTALESVVQESSGFLEALFQNNSVYDKLPETITNKMSGIFSNIDYDTISKYMTDSNGMLSQSMMEDWVDGIASSLDNKTVQNQLDELFALDTKKTQMNFKDYQKQANDLIDSISSAIPELSPDLLKKTTGIEDTVDELQTAYNRVSKLFGEDKANRLSNENLEIAMDLIAEDNFSGTFDELLQKISAVKKASEDINANPIFDSIATADETENAGADYEKAVTYLQEAKEMYEKGLVGTDDFKRRAAYLSPTESDDPANFIENYSKAARYLTEDGSGVQNFLNDLEKKGYATFETLSDGTQQWSYNIQDLQEASQNMGMGFEFMMDMFGRLEDYGFHNNFVSSVEDGAKRIGELTSQLVQEEAKLAEMETTGQYTTVDENGNEQKTVANQTAIDAQREKVQALRNDILETQSAMDQLTAINADNYNKQVESAKQAISSLKEERDKILKDNTYGENTDSVVKLMDQQIQQWASENGIELDAEMNIVDNGSLDKINEAKKALEELQQQGEISADIEFDVDVSKLDEAGIESRISELTDLKDHLIEINSDTSQIEYVDQLLNEANARKEQLAQQTDVGISVDIAGKEDLDSLGQKLSNLPKDETSNVSINIQNESQLDGVVQQIEQIPKDTPVNLSLTVQNQEQADALEDKLSGLASEGHSIQYSIDVVDNTGDALNKDVADDTKTITVNEVQGTTVDVEDDTKTVTVNEVQGTTVDVQDESKTVTVNYTKGSQAPPDDKNATVNYNKGKQEKPSDEDALVNYLLGSQASPIDKTASVDYILGSQAGPSNKTAYVNYIATGDTGEGNRAKGTFLSVARSSGTAYNTINTIPAHASGNVALQKNERALVNEFAPQAPESIVRDGRWFIIPGGPQLANLKKGDILFNANQTAELLKAGKTSIPGKAYADGTVGNVRNLAATSLSAFAGGSGGGVLGWGGSGSKANWSGVKTNSSTNKATQSVNKAANNLSSAAKETSEAAEKLSDTLSGYTDWGERVFEAREREIDHLTSQMERIAHLTDKQIKTYEILSKNREYLNNTQTAKQTYQSHLDMLQSQMNLNPTIIKQIQTGSFDISKYDDETQKLISEYQEYYDKLQDCSAQYDDLLAQQDELAQTALDNVSNYYDMFNQVDQAMQGWLEAQRDLWENQGLSATADSQYASIQSSLEQERKVAERLEQKISSYTDEINKLISNGYMDRHSEAYYEANEALNGFKQELYESQSAIIEFEDQLRELDYTALQNKIDGFARAVDKISAQINLMEARDEKVPESVYQQQIDANNSQIEANQELRASKLKEQGLYDVGSTRYQELAEEINDLDVETLNLLADNEALKDSIYELRFDRLDNQLKVYDDLKTEIDDFRSLLNEDAFFDKNGVVTEEGLAELALLQQGIIASKREVADYREGLEKLKESYVNGVISLDEYNEKSEEYCAGIRESIKDVSDYEDALTDLYMTQMRTESEALQEVIDKRKEALQAKADYYNYNKTISDKQKDINMLRAEIQALTGVNNAAAQARLKQLQSDLQEAQSDLDDTKYQHSIDMQQQGYDSMSDQLNQILGDTEYEITHNAEKQQEVVQSMLNNVVNMYESAYGKINSIIENTGWAGSYAFRQNQTQLSTSTGAQTQTNNATQSQSNVKPSDAANSTITNPIDNNESYNNKIEQEITQAPNTENRLVAELKLSPTSVSLEEGKSTKITASMRPNDAKNKTLSWKSSNTSIATVSSGTIKAIKAGSCQITASTTDGSGLSITVGVTVTAKPKPVQPEKKPSTPSTSGDGVPNIGDAVTYTSGRYYYSSDGLKPSGNQYLGKTVYIGHINNADWATKPYALYADKEFKHPLGWVSLDQISGYAKGTKSVPYEQIAEVNEEGRELIVTSDGRVLRRLQPGDGVIPNNITENLLKMGENPAKFVQDAITQVQTPVVNKISSGDMNVTNHYDSLLTVNGNVDKEALPELKEILKKSYDYTVQNIAKDAAKMGFKKRF